MSYGRIPGIDRLSPGAIATQRGPAWPPTLNAKRSLSPSSLNDFLTCRHKAALQLAGIQPAGPADPTLELIRQKGFEHEAAVLVRLEEIYGPAIRIPEKGDLSHRMELTRKAIRAGGPLIYQGALSHDDWQGSPDFLVAKRVNGSLCIEPEDAKLARKAKGPHILQLGVYAEILEACFGIPVHEGVIHLALGDPERFDLRRTRYILKRLMRNFEQFVAKESRNTQPHPCTACAQCDFKPRCEEEWREDDSLFFVAGLRGLQAAKLAEAGVVTLAQLAAVTPSQQVSGIGNEALEKLAAQARLQLRARETSTHSFELLPVERGRGFCLLPAPDASDIFFDIEGNPLAGDGQYLFGMYGAFDGAAAPVFNAIWAHDPVAEKAAFEQTMRLFVSQMQRHPAAHIYHYAPYDPSALKRLAMRYATMEAELDQLLRERRFIDLYRVSIQALRASTESYSLKDLEAFYLEARAGDVKTAADSIVEYERWCITGDPAILDAIEGYNREDCVSTAHLRDWLESLRPRGAFYDSH